MNELTLEDELMDLLVFQYYRELKSLTRLEADQIEAALKDIASVIRGKQELNY